MAQRSGVHHEALDILATHDRWLADHIGPLSTLNPERTHATSLEALGHALLTDVHDSARAVTFAQGLTDISRARVEHFPETLFWDLDAVASSLLTSQDTATLRARADALVQLHEVFGRRGAINFRYVHDFAYGYDWARWVGRDPNARAHVGPYCPDFVAYLMRRAGELVTLIASDDEKYPKLPDGRPRNPFGFSREPSHERALHEALARRDHIPVRAWELQPPMQWNRPYAELRDQCSLELDIPSHRERA